MIFERNFDNLTADDVALLNEYFHGYNYHSSSHTFLANFIWPLLFFAGEWFLAALIWLVVLWILIFLTIRAFSKIDERAGDLLIPYILWVTFAAYLNLGIFLLN